MNKLINRFEELRNKKKGTLITYFPIGEPEYETLALAEAYIENGADLLEIALPVADPFLDGKVVAQSMSRVREAGRQLDWLLKEMFKIRTAYPDTPLQIFSYMKIFDKKAIDEFAVCCRQMGADGILLCDATEAQLRALAEAFAPDFYCIRFMPFRCEMADVELIKDYAKGYIFLQAADGVTGERGSVDKSLKGKISFLHEQIPGVSICAGFGISTPRHCREMVEMGADGVIVGSMVIRKLMSTSLTETGRLIKELKSNLR